MSGEVFQSNQKKKNPVKFLEHGLVFIPSVCLSSQCVCVCVFVRICVYVLISVELSRTSSPGKKEPGNLQKHFSAEYACCVSCVCVCSCVVDPEELREADGEKVFALQFTSIICPPPLSRASSPLPRSTIPLPSHFPIPALRSSLGQKKNTHTRMCVCD